MFIIKKIECPNNHSYFRYFNQEGQVIESGLAPSDVNPTEKHMHKCIAPSNQAEFTADEFKAQVQMLVKNEKCYMVFHDLDAHTMHAHVIAKN
tara:strand:+ start:3249 stop:3527 length:279 start_codon:yes stop_codon:yes gene_type:complete